MAVVGVVSAVVAASASVSFGIINQRAAEDAADAQKTLADEQAGRLQKEQADRAAMAAAQATTGVSFGKDATNAAVTGLGFGSGNAGPNTGFGRAQLTGGGANP